MKPPRSIGLSAIGGTLKVGFAYFFQAGLGAGQAALVLDGGFLFRGFSQRGQGIREIIERRLAVNFLIYSRPTCRWDIKK